MIIIDIDIEFQNAAIAEIEFLTRPKGGDGVAFHIPHGGHHMIFADEEAGVRVGAVAGMGGCCYMLRQGRTFGLGPAQSMP